MSAKHFSQVLSLLECHLKDTDPINLLLTTMCNNSIRLLFKKPKAKIAGSVINTSRGHRAVTVLLTEATFPGWGKSGGNSAFTPQVVGNT